MSHSRYFLPPPASNRRSVNVNLIDFSSTEQPRPNTFEEFDPILATNVNTSETDKRNTCLPSPSAPLSIYSELSLSAVQTAREYGTLPRPPTRADPPAVATEMPSFIMTPDDPYVSDNVSNNTSPVMPRPRSAARSPESRSSTLYPTLPVPDSPVMLRNRSGRLGVATSASTSAIDEVGTRRRTGTNGGSTQDLSPGINFARRLQLVPGTPNAECRQVIETVRFMRREADEGAVEENNPGVVFNAVYRKPFPIPDAIIVNVRYGRLLSRITKDSSLTFKKIQCNPNTADVSMLLNNAIPWDDFPMTNTLSPSDFFLRVHGRDEFLRPSCTLAQHAYFQDCNRQQWQVRLVLDHREDLHPERLKRTGRDLREEFILPARRDCKELTKDELQLLLDVFTKERQNFLSNLQAEMSASDYVRLVQAVKAICASMENLTTLDVRSSCDRLEEAMYRTTHSRDDIHTILSRLELGVIALVRLYCVLFELPYTLADPNHVERTVRVTKNVQGCRQTVSVYVGALHRIQPSKLSNYDLIRVRALLTYGGHPLYGKCSALTKGQPVRNSSAMLRSPVSGAPASAVPVFWDEWLIFESLQVSSLPLETVLLLSVVGVKKNAPQGGTVSTSVPSGSEDSRENSNDRQRLFWATLPLFDADREYRQGLQLIPLWPTDQLLPLSGCAPFNFDPSAPVLEIALPELKEPLQFPERPIGDYEDIQMSDFDKLSLSDQTALQRILDSEESTTRTLLEVDREKLWNSRHALLDRSDALVKVMYAAPVGKPPPSDIYSLVTLWRVPEPELALQLLGPEICDIEIRRKAVQWLRVLNPDELMLYMPQLMQVFKYDLYTDSSSLFELFLDYSLKNMNFANNLFWHLKECRRTSVHARRVQTLFDALLKSCGAAMKAVWRGQETLTAILSTTAEAVRATSAGEGRMARLQTELVKLKDWMTGSGAELCPLRVPFNLGLVGTELCIRECSYFSSFTCPLRLVFKTPDVDAPDLNIMFKAGDDLRQDGLMLQLTAVMDRLWLQECLDLRMVLFRILSTAEKQGFIELVSESTTLRKIQEAKGVTGAFRENVIRTWLQKHNPTQLEYSMAVHNFKASCAGCCVATYVLGVGDRHNDNIMIGKAGHMVHIDFAKILGDAQTFVGIKRDRVPFVFTSEMARVLEDAGEGEYDGRTGFQAFIDLCCRALNILRAHADQLLGLARILLPSGIPGLRQDGVVHMRRALMLDMSDLEVNAHFARLIEKSLGSMSTTLNFFIHGLAQAKQGGREEGPFLSSTSHSIKTDGRISSVSIKQYQKIYHPEREYRFILSVYREGNTEPWHIFRTFSQFEDLHRRLTSRFPLVAIPSLHESVSVPGRSHVHTVAERRMQSLQAFISALFLLAPEISECDMVYTFFHSTLQDEQDYDKLDYKLKSSGSSRNRDQRESGRSNSDVSTGEIELRIRYEADQLSVLVITAKLNGGKETPPDTYVKVYLRPDDNKQTKHKTKVVRHNYNPSYNYLIEYKNISESSLSYWTLEASVWEVGSFRSTHIGSVRLPLTVFATLKDSQKWYELS